MSDVEVESAPLSITEVIARSEHELRQGFEATNRELPVISKAARRAAEIYLEVGGKNKEILKALLIYDVIGKGGLYDFNGLTPENFYERIDGITNDLKNSVGDDVALSIVGLTAHLPGIKHRPHFEYSYGRLRAEPDLLAAKYSIVMGEMQYPDESTLPLQSDLKRDYLFLASEPAKFPDQINQNEIIKALRNRLEITKTQFPFATVAPKNQPSFHTT